VTTKPPFHCLRVEDKMYLNIQIIQGNSKVPPGFPTSAVQKPDGHAEGEYVNRGRNTPSFCPTLHVLGMSTLGDAADVNTVIKFLQLW
jgi:hypothetical protein